MQRKLLIKAFKEIASQTISEHTNSTFSWFAFETQFADYDFPDNPYEWSLLYSYQVDIYIIVYDWLFILFGYNSKAFHISYNILEGGVVEKMQEEIYRFLPRKDNIIRRIYGCFCKYFKRNSV